MKNAISKPTGATAVVVNDDPTQLNMLCGLVRKAGLKPRSFTAAEAALAEMSAHAAAADGDPGALPALVVTDLHMPGIDGWRFCRLLRSPEYAAFNQVPILVVSATFTGDEPDRIAADLGVEAFLPSPVDGKRFVEQVQAILKGRQVRKPLRVLIVEDSKTLAGMLQKAFAAQGYQADTALTARAAADAFVKTAYDVAVLDYHLPDGTGDVLLDAFHAQRPDCVCLMMTIDPGPELALDWMKRGAAAYLRKPFEPDYLIELCAKARRERALLRVQDLMKMRTRELRERDIQFAKLSAWLPGMIYQFTRRPDGTYCVPFATEGIKDIFGCSPQDVREDFSPVARVILPEDLDTVVGSIEYSAKHLTVWTCEYRVQIPGQSIRWMLGNSTPEKLADGSITWHGFNMDITERKRAEGSLKESESKYGLLFENMEEGFALHEIVTDENGHTIDFRFLDANAAYERHTGLKPQDCIGKTIREIMPQVDPRQIENYGKVALTGDPLAFDYYSKTFSRHFRIRAFSPQPRRFATIFEDITERKQAEEEKAKLEAQLQQAQKMESVGRLAGGVAHDFNNMLGVILGHTEIAMGQVDPAQPLHGSLAEIHKAAERAADLTRQLLAFARKQTIAPKVLDLNKTVAGILKMLQRLIGEDIHLDWQPEADLWPVKVDPSQIDQILANLCVNARDAIADVGKIAIEMGNSTLDAAYCADHPGFVTGEYVRLAVSDDGCGMDRETLDKLFEPFFTTKEIGKGTGLGLATAYGIVKQNNGFIDVYSEPGRGTTFTIYLPRHVGKAARTEGAARTALRGRETILLVEDESAILKITKMMLEHQGYTVVAASTPGEAIRLAREHAGEIHLLMTDVIMPEMNGRDLAKNLLALYPDLTRLFMSGYTADLIAHHGVLDQGVHFIQKPFSIKNLAAKVREALDSE
jgi:PAS domain S-box-containing protein